MAQLTIEHLSCYLPYGLRCNLMGEVSDDTHNLILFEIVQLSNVEVECHQIDGCVINLFPLNDVFPLLRPLSQLTQDIEHNGERFVPIVELAKIAENDNWLDSEVRYKSSEHTHGVGWTNDSTRYVFAYSTAHNGFYLECNPYRQLIIANQHKLFQKLAEWHLDFQGLIEQGLALPIQ